MHELHIEDEPNVMRYSEKLVRDEVSSCSSVHDLSGPSLMQPSHFDTGGTLHDCIDFDELMNDFIQPQPALSCFASHFQAP